MVDAKTGFEMAKHIDEVDGDGDDIEGGGVEGRGGVDKSGG